MAASRALAELAKQPVPENVSAAYGGQKFEFGREYIIPKPFDPRVLHWEAFAVAKAACETGVAKDPITDWEGYKARLEGMTSKSYDVMRAIVATAKKARKRIVFPEGEATKIVEACRVLVDEGMAKPILLGNAEVITGKAKKIGLDPKALTIIDPEKSTNFEAFAQELYKARGRKGYTPKRVEYYVRRPLHQAMMMLRLGMADGMVAGIERSYVDTLEIVIPLAEMKEGASRVIGMHLILVGGKVYLFADTTVNIQPEAPLLVEITLQAAKVARHFGMDPKIAMLAFSNFGDNSHPLARKVRDAVEILHRDHPDLAVDGEMHGDVAISPTFAKENYPLSKVQGDANVLIFPGLNSGNIAYKLITHLAGGEAIGPLLIGLKYPVNVVNFNSTVRDIVNMAALSAYQAGG